MQLFVLGATGGTGRESIEQALNRLRHRITAAQSAECRHFANQKLH